MHEYMVANLKIDKRVYWLGAWSIANKANTREAGEGE